MKWFNRVKEGILTSTKEKKEIPDGIWWNCPSCKSKVTTKELQENLSICPSCKYHSRIGSAEYFEILFDNNEFTELNPNLASADPLEFIDTKAYPDRKSVV